MTIDDALNYKLYIERSYVEMSISDYILVFNFMAEYIRLYLKEDLTLNTYTCIHEKKFIL